MQNLNVDPAQAIVANGSGAVCRGLQSSIWIPKPHHNVKTYTLRRHGVMARYSITFSKGRCVLAPATSPATTANRLAIASAIIQI